MNTTIRPLPCRGSALKSQRLYSLFPLFYPSCVFIQKFCSHIVHEVALSSQQIFMELPKDPFVLDAPQTKTTLETCHPSSLVFLRVSSYTYVYF